MKSFTPASIALLGAFSMSSHVTAEFMGLVTSYDVPVSGYFVTRVWASFSSTNDRLLNLTAASMTSDAPLYQHPFSPGSTAPSEALLGFDPMLQHDSFVTIGLAVVPLGGTDSTGIEPGSPGFNQFGFQGGWFNSNPTNPQGVPVAIEDMQAFTSSGEVQDADLRFYVLIAQLTTQQPAMIQGSLFAGWKVLGGTTVFTPASFAIPAPGALGVLAISGLVVGTRSRRRF